MNLLYYALGLPLASVDIAVHGLGSFGGVAAILFAVAGLLRAYAAVVTAHAAIRSLPARPAQAQPTRKECRGERLPKSSFSNPDRS